MFLAEKRDGRVKERGCSDGRKQRMKTSKEDAASTTVAMKISIIDSAIEAHEDRDVATINIPGVYLHTESNKYMIMVLR